MRAVTVLTLLLVVLLLGGCAAMETRPAPLSREDIVRLAQAGEPPKDIIRKLQETGTVVLLSASDIVKLHQAGVPQEVLDYLQQVQIDAIRRRDALDRAFAWPYGSHWNCGWPPYRFHPHPFSVLPHWPGC